MKTLAQEAGEGGVEEYGVGKVGGKGPAQTWAGSPSVATTNEPLASAAGGSQLKTQREHLSDNAGRPGTQRGARSGRGPWAALLARVRPPASSTVQTRGRVRAGAGAAGALT